MIYKNHLYLLTQLKLAGFKPELILDCGSAIGTWTQLSRAIWPQVPICSFDPISYSNDNPEILRKDNIFSLNVLLSNKVGELKTFYHYTETPMRSSYLADPHIDFGPNYQIKTNVCENIPTETLDNILKQTNVYTKKPILIKLDTQGSELDILQGAEETLEKTEILIIETSTIVPTDNYPDFYDIVDFMKSKGFVVYSAFEAGDYDDCHILTQLDITFIKKDHPIRKVLTLK